MPAAARELALRVEHASSWVGADGVARSARFSEQFIVQGEQSWLERIMPAGAPAQPAHAADEADHHHLDAAAAPRWVQRTGDGRLRVRIVDPHGRRVFDVGPPDFGAIGFDGAWATASHLLDPAQLARLKATRRSAATGTRWHEGTLADGSTVRVLWDELGEYPQRIESTHPQGLRRSTLVATPMPMPRTLPWRALDGYAQREYSDLLD